MPVETESSKFLESSKRAPTLQINIEIKPGQTEVLIVREGESAEQISRAFAEKYGLQESLEFMLREQIIMNMSKSNLMESLARSLEVGNYSREDVPSEEDDNHQAQLNTINSLDPKGWSNQKEKILEAGETYLPKHK